MSDTTKTFTREQLAEATKIALEKAKKEYENKLSELQTNVTELNDKLNPYIQKERNVKLKELTTDLKIKDEMFEDVLILSKLSDDDDEETIKNKIQATVDKRKYFLKENDSDFMKKKELNDVKKPEKTKQKSYKYN